MGVSVKPQRIRHETVDEAVRLMAAGFREQGWRRSGRHWYADGSDQRLVVGVWKHRHNTAEHVVVGTDGAVWHGALARFGRCVVAPVRRAIDRAAADGRCMDRAELHDVILAACEAGTIVVVNLPRTCDQGSGRCYHSHPSQWVVSFRTTPSELARQLVVDAREVSEWLRPRTSRAGYQAWCWDLVDRGDAHPGHVLDLLALTSRSDPSWDELHLRMERTIHASRMRHGERSASAMLREALLDAAGRASRPPWAALTEPR